MQNTTPNQSVKLLLASGDVKKVGTGEGARRGHHALLGHGGRGRPRRHELQPHRSQLADLKKQLTRAGVTTETVDIWVDGRGPPGQEDGEGPDDASGEYTQTAYYSDYGVKVYATEPAGERHRGLQGLC